MFHKTSKIFLSRTYELFCIFTLNELTILFNLFLKSALSELEILEQINSNSNLDISTCLLSKEIPVDENLLVLVMVTTSRFAHTATYLNQTSVVALTLFVIL